MGQKRGPLLCASQPFVGSARCATVIARTIIAENGKPFMMAISKHEQNGMSQHTTLNCNFFWDQKFVFAKLLLTAKIRRHKKLRGLQVYVLFRWLRAGATRHVGYEAWHIVEG